MNIDILKEIDQLKCERFTLTEQVQIPLNQNLRKELTMAEPKDMYQCQTVNCGYIYNPDKGDRKGKIAKGTKFEDLPDDWKCPICGAEGDLDDGTISQLKERFGGKESPEMTLKCPTCAGTFKVKEDDTSIICPFCGAKGKASA